MIRVRVDALRPGDYLPETDRNVISVTRGARTPPGKHDVILSRDGATLPSVRWNSKTLIGIERKPSENVADAIPYLSKPAKEK